MQNNKKGALSAASMRARSAPRRPACMYTQPPGGGSFFNRATRSPLQATRAAKCAGGGVCMRQPVSVPVERGCATTARGCAEHSRLPAGTYPPWLKADKCQRERGRSAAMMMQRCRVGCDAARRRGGGVNEPGLPSHSLRTGTGTAAQPSPACPASTLTASRPYPSTSLLHRTHTDHNGTMLTRTQSE